MTIVIGVESQCLTLGSGVEVTSTAADAIRNKFIVRAQKDAGMSLDEAHDLAEFISTLGDSVLQSIVPALNKYKERVAVVARDEVIKEILNDFSVAAHGIVWTRNSVLSRIRSHLRNGNGIAQ